MTDTELREAAERVVKFVAKYDMHPVAHKGLEDAKAVATRLLELLPPADDGEFTTPEWLKSIGAVEVPREPFERDLGPLRLSWWSGGERGEWEVTLGNSVFPHMNTRGHVRRLASALGITITEPTP